MSLTCIACKLLFSVPELHHEHYKSDWHRYNLKRRIAELPPLTKEEFEERAAAFKANVEEKDEKLSLRCESCNKRFSSKNALINHLKSKRHLEIEAGDKTKSKKAVVLTKKLPTQEPSKLPVQEVVNEADSDAEWSDDDGEWESCDEDEDGNPKTIVIDTNDCLFCEHQSDSTENNVTHMTEAHSFYIPDIEYLSDLDGLIAALAAKIHIGYTCLWCNGKGKGFRSVTSVKQHMISKGHCKMLHEGEALLDYADFYDYSTTEASKEFVDTETISDLIEESDYELVLPSGSTVGHRSLAIYYKQNLKPVNSDNSKKVKKILQQYKALGYTGATGQAAIIKARDIVFMQRIKNRYNLKLGLKQNKLQPHFRSQVMF